MTNTPESVVTVETRAFRSEDVTWLEPLFETCFDRKRPPQEWEWMYRRETDPSLVHVLLVNGAPVGFVGRLYFSAWVGGRRARLSHASDLMTNPSIRGSGLKNALVDPIRRSLDLVDVNYGFPAEISVHVAEKIKWDMGLLGRVPQWVRWQSSAAVVADNPKVPTIVARLGVAAVRSFAAVAARAARRRPIAEVDALSLERWADAFDDLADRSKSFATAILVRDAAYVRWRWLEHPTTHWTVLVAIDPHRPTVINGYIAFGVHEGQGRIVDLLAEDATSMQVLCREAVRRLSETRVERILCELHDPRRWSATVLRRNGFLPRGEGPNMTAQRHSAWVPDAITDMSRWYVTFADVDFL